MGATFKTGVASPSLLESDDDESEELEDAALLFLFLLRLRCARGFTAAGDIYRMCLEERTSNYFIGSQDQEL